MSKNNVFANIIKEYERSQREKEKKFQQECKNLIRQINEQLVSLHNLQIDTLTSLYRCKNIEEVNYNDLNSLEYPIEPAYSNKNELIAQQELDNYSPYLLTRVFFPFLVSRKKEKLKEKLLKAKEKDIEEYNLKLEEYQTECKKIKNYKDFSKKVLENNDYRDAFIYLNTLFNKSSEEYDITFGNPESSIIYKVNQLDFDFKSNKAFIQVILHSNDELFSETKYVLKSGELSTKAVSIEKFNTLNQDYICSAAITLARDAFKITPLDNIYVNIVTNQRNPSTGFMEDVVILSVCFDRSTFNSINFESIDASSFIKSLKHNMKFTKKDGLEQVKSLF